MLLSMAKFRGKALLPHQFVTRYLIPGLIANPHYVHLLKHPLRRYFSKNNPEKDIPVSQISLRVNEVCNLRCASCGQWGENGHLRKKVSNNEKLTELDFDIVKRIVNETRHDHPMYYIWGGEPTLWKPLVPLFAEMGRHKLYGSVVTNAQALLPILDDLIDTGALNILFLSLDGWDSASQNIMRSPAGGQNSKNFEKTMEVIEQIRRIKERKKLRFPFVMPITVISNHNYPHLEKIHRLVQDTTQLHPYYFGWFIPEDRAILHEKVFTERFGTTPGNHRGYLKSCFNDVDPAIIAQQISNIRELSKTHASVAQFLPDIYTEQDIRRYYNDHSWDCGYPECESIYHVAEISPDGRITPCRDYQDYTAGNINTESFYDIWNGEAFKKFRREMKKGLMPVCTRCCGLQGF
jgi:radical SAM protein with 4Fe4S-binding SPASM domain